jgi:hypothetical protein
VRQVGFIILIYYDARSKKQKTKSSFWPKEAEMLFSQAVVFCGKINHKRKKNIREKRSTYEEYDKTIRKKAHYV